MRDWIIEETKTADFNDLRLNERYALTLDRIGERPFDSLPAAHKGMSETIAAYRFFNNKKVSFDNVLSTHYSASLERIKGEKVILAVNDTTSLDYTNKEVVKELGHLENENCRGLFLHATLLLNPEGIPFGNYKSEVWTRDLEEFGKKEDRKNKPIEEKESIRWLNSYHHACEITEKYPEKTIVSVGDRESDIYELFAEASKAENKAELLVRAGQNRNTIDEDNEKKLLWESLESTPEIGKLEVNISRTNERKARKATLTVRAKSVKLKAPYRKDRKLPDLAINAVLISEENVPADIEPIEWLLLTTLPANNIENAKTVLLYYRCRWQIEIFFRILKSGCRVEDIQLEKQTRLESCLALYMIIAWRVFFLVMLGRKCPDLPAEVVFDKDEWEILCIIVKNKKPKESPRLNDAIKMIASLGGYLGRKGDGEPGPKYIWIGLRRLADFTITYIKMKELETCV